MVVAGNDKRKTAIEDFSEMAALDKKAMEALSKVLAEGPSAIMIAWEQAGKVKATTVPFSVCILKGMVYTLDDLVFGDLIEDADEVEDD